MRSTIGQSDFAAAGALAGVSALGAVGTVDGGHDLGRDLLGLAVAGADEDDQKERNETHVNPRFSGGNPERVNLTVFPAKSKLPANIMFLGGASRPYPDRSVGFVDCRAIHVFL